jgi:hypothetical protein
VVIYFANLPREIQQHYSAARIAAIVFKPLLLRPTTTPLVFQPGDVIRIRLFPQNDIHVWRLNGTWKLARIERGGP